MKVKTIVHASHAGQGCKEMCSMSTVRNFLCMGSDRHVLHREIYGIIWRILHKCSLSAYLCIDFFLKFNTTYNKTADAFGNREICFQMCA